MARPSKYTKKLADNICKQIADGESVRKICEKKSMPNASTVHAWVLDNEAFSKQYARAKSIGAEIEFEELDDIAKNEPDVQRARLRVDTKKWSLSKKIPKKYGDKLDLTNDGEKFDGIGTIIIKSPDEKNTGTKSKS